MSGSTINERKRRPRRKSRNSSVIGILVLLLVCLCLAAGSLGVYIVNQQVKGEFGPPSNQLSALQRITYTARLFLYRNELSLPAHPGGVERSFEVRLGESVGSVAARLEENGLIPSASAFRLYLIYSGLDTSIQAGSYELSPAMAPVEIAHQLQDATPKEVTFHILPGLRLEEIAALLPTSGLSITPEVFLQAAQNKPPSTSFSDELPADATYEGFLFPDTYQFDRNISLPEMLAKLAGNFDANLSPDIRKGFEHQRLSLYQAVTLASIVQREAMVEEEQPIIASVFLNRLAAGMNLDSDPTVQYALGYNTQQDTWWTNPLTNDDLQVSSPYNTYLRGGLPPGPIDNPGLPALQAVAFPAQTPYYYFRARCDGSGRHLFARTLEEQVNNACQ